MLEDKFSPLQLVVEKLSSAKFIFKSIALTVVMLVQTSGASGSYCSLHTQHFKI